MKALLFDLDGTLTESGEGIIRSVQYALRKFGITGTGTELLRRFIGPPLMDSFTKYCGFTREEAKEAVRIYRERFSSVGMFENRLYPGIPEMLKQLKEAGFLLAVASSKPEPFVLQILDHFAIGSYFNEAAGSTLNDKRTGKAAVIAEVLTRMDLTDRKMEVLMVGDTEHDVSGAKECGLSCVAVTYGYGDTEKIKAESPAAVLDTVEELREYLLRLGGRI